MDVITIMVRETKILRHLERERALDEVIDKYPNANEIQLEEETDRRMKEAYVDAFTILFQNNLSFCMALMKTDLAQRVFEEKERLINQEINDDPDSDEEQELLMDAVTLSREYIEELFID